MRNLVVIEVCNSLGSAMFLVILSSRRDCRSFVKVLRDRGVDSDSVQLPLISLHSIVDSNHEQFSRASKKWSFFSAPFAMKSFWDFPTTKHFFVFSIVLLQIADKAKHYFKPNKSSYI